MVPLVRTSLLHLRSVTGLLICSKASWLAVLLKAALVSLRRLRSSKDNQECPAICRLLERPVSTHLLVLLTIRSLTARLSSNNNSSSSNSSNNSNSNNSSNNSSTMGV